MMKIMVGVFMTACESEKKIQSRLDLGEAFKNEYFTPREIEVAKNIILGKTAKDIAKELSLSFRTVESYIDTIKAKLRCHSKGKVIEILFKSGLVYKLGLLK